MANLTQMWRSIGLIEELLGLKDAASGDAISDSYSEATRRCVCLPCTLTY